MLGQRRHHKVMPKVTAPLLSFGASGQVGKTLVASKWKGRAYMRQYVIPGNPNSSEQQLTRNAFTWLQAVYKIAPPLFTAPWEAYATGKVMTARNALTKFNLPGLREETDLTNFVFCPGALGGLPPASINVTPGSGQLTIDITAPTTVPDGWTINSAVAAVILDQDPQTEADYVITAGSDATSTYQVVLTGLSAALYQVGAWLVWNRPDGKLAYSPSVQDTGTPS